jgi:SsrA-binding protein
MHRAELRKRYAQVREKGLSIVPLKLYVARGRIKVELALVQGKEKGDKRQALKEKGAKKELARLRDR